MVDQCDIFSNLYRDNAGPVGNSTDRSDCITRWLIWLIWLNLRRSCFAVYNAERPTICVDLYRAVRNALCHLYIKTVQIQCYIGNADINTVLAGFNLIRLVQSEGIALLQSSQCLPHRRIVLGRIIADN